MGLLKGQTEYRRFKKGEALTRGEAIKAMCFVCNGQEESNADCRGYSCPLYAFHPHRPDAVEIEETAVSVPAVA